MRQRRLALLALLLPLTLAACGSSSSNSAGQQPAPASPPARPAPASGPVAAATAGSVGGTSPGPDLYGISKKIVLDKGGLQSQCQRIEDANLSASSGIKAFRKLRCYYSGDISYDVFQYYAFTSQAELDSNVNAYKSDPGATSYLVNGMEVILPSTSYVIHSDLPAQLAQQVHDACNCGVVRAAS